MEETRVLHMNENSNASAPSSDSGLVVVATSELDGSINIVNSGSDEIEPRQKLDDSGVVINDWLPKPYLEALSDESPVKLGNGRRSAAYPDDPTWQPVPGLESEDESEYDSPVKQKPRIPRKVMDNKSTKYLPVDGKKSRVRSKKVKDVNGVGIDSGKNEESRPIKISNLFEKWLGSLKPVGEGGQENVNPNCNNAVPATPNDVTGRVNFSPKTPNHIPPESKQGSGDSPERSVAIESPTSAGVGEEEVVDGVITHEMLKEEEELAKNNELEAAKAHEAMIKKTKLQIEREQSDDAIREQSRKRLMNLLEKSKFYADFMKKQLDIEKQKKKRKPKEPTSSPTTTSIQAGKRKRKLCAKYSEDMYESVQAKKRNGGTALKDLSNEMSEINSSESLPNNTSTDSLPPGKKTGTKLTSLGIEVHEEQPDLLEGACLREYQLEGFNWLKDLFEKGMNGILADEMGLGKTIQTISLICHLYSHGVHGPFLIVAPLSTLPNWVHEFETFAPKVPVVLYHGSEVKRRSLVNLLRKDTMLLGKKVLPVVVTSYEVPIKDVKLLSPITWKFIIVDEGHRIKNYKTQLARTLSGMRSINRLLLTGTPLQNDLIELWSLLHFILPEVFDSLEVFESLFTAEELAQNENTDVCLEKEEKSKILTLLHEVLTPFLLRRLKSDVDLKIPAKKEILVHCPMTRIQLDLYRAVLDETILLFSRHARRISVSDESGPKKKRYSKLRDPSECEAPFQDEMSEVVVFGNKDFQYKLKVKMTMPHIVLMKILNHPYLVHPKVLPGSDILQVDDELIESSGKMTILDGLLERLKPRGHRVLIFSTYTSLLDMVEEYAYMKGYQFRRLDGNTDIDARRERMRDFNTDPNIFLFLLSTRAGGLGVNLTGADTVIIFNSDWNPQADLQAQDRCHRIGQTKPVVVYRFMTPGTVDERIINRAESKRKLEKMVLQKGKFKHGSAGKEDITLTLNELKTLLEEKQHNQEILSNGTTLTDEQWDALLDRSDLLK